MNYKYNDMGGEKIGEYDEFANQQYDFEEQIKETNEEYDKFVKQELFNLKIEKLIAIDEEKQVFDEKYKESLVSFMNKHYYKDRRNTVSVIGKLHHTLHQILSFLTL